MKHIIIIKHNSPGDYFAYDILIKKGKKLPIKFGKSLIDKESGYITNCPFVKEFINDNPTYELLFSEDMGHIPGWNWIESFVDYLVSHNKATLIDKSIKTVKPQINISYEDFK